MGVKPITDTTSNLLAATIQQDSAEGWPASDTSSDYVGPQTARIYANRERRPLHIRKATLPSET